jgi:hypothetical protein
MMGDPPDIVARLKAVLPSRWFPDRTPVLDGVLAGLADTWSRLGSLLEYTRAQTRIASVTDLFLDAAAKDFFGARMVRRADQGDEPFRARVQREMLRERATRTALAAVLEDLTGSAPVIFEPARPADTGAWGLALGWGCAGGWGSLSLPFQCLVTAWRPQGNGIAIVAGWAIPAGGWGGGLLQYASLDMLQGQVTDDDIRAAIVDTMPAATIAWTRIAN